MKYLAVLIALSTSFFWQENINKKDHNHKHPNKEEFKVQAIESINGKYMVSPQIPKDGYVPKGTVLSVKAYPDSGFVTDAVFSSVKGGMWGFLTSEHFSDEMKVTVDKDMYIGASFVEKALVQGIDETQNIVYAKPGRKELKYDVFSPKNAKMLPAIIIVHGGGWASNNEDIMRGLARELAKNGKYVVFSIDYRWIYGNDNESSPTYMHNIIEDVFGAIAHIQQHASEYGADGSRIAITGDSAGGHLAEAAAVFAPQIGNRGFGIQQGIYEFEPTYQPKDLSLSDIRRSISTSIKAVAPSYAPSDQTSIQSYIAHKDPNYPWNEVSPINHVPKAKDRLLPHFVTHGTKDFVVPYETVKSYVQVLRENGQPVEHLEVEGAYHAFFDWTPYAKTMETFRQFGLPYANKMEEFFNGIFYK